MVQLRSETGRLVVAGTAVRSVCSAMPRLAAAISLAAALLAPPTASAITMDWVTVGSPGNAADTRYMNCGPSSASPCSAVPYAYNTGKYEVTNSQYAELLNNVAATDTNGLRCWCVFSRVFFC